MSSFHAFFFFPAKNNQDYYLANLGLIITDIFAPQEIKAFANTAFIVAYS